MTAQTSPPLASGAPLPPTPFASLPSSLPPSAKDDFLAMILQALTGRPSTADNPPAAQPAKDKPAPTAAAARDPTVASFLLALLTPPLPTLPKLPSHKVSAPGGSGIHSIPLDEAAPATAPSASETKPPRRDAAATLLTPAPPPKEPESKTAPVSGTPVANTSPGMNLSSQRNEIAPRLEKKLPPEAISAVSSADAGGASPDGGAKLPLSFSWQEAPAEQLTIIDLSAKAGSPAATVAETTVDAPVRAAGPAPLDRLEQMIAREVTSVRQTGAQTLGVSLKLDSNTQLFLQLTTNNGLVQASVRCDRGQFAPEDAQWAQLQQSLARQNVELLPMTGSSNLNFQQPSGQNPRQPAPREDGPVAAAATPPAPPRKQQQKQQNRSSKNWESWA